MAQDTDDVMLDGLRTNRVLDRVSSPEGMREFLEFCAKNDKGLKPIFKLFMNHMNLISKEPWATQELFLKILGAVLSTRNFRYLITTGETKDLLDPFWSSVADHNRKVRHEVAIRGINDSTWIWDNTLEMEELLEHDPSKVNELWEELEKSLDDFAAGYVGSNLHRSITKDVMGIKKRKAEIQKGKIDLPIPKESPFFPTFNKTFSYLQKRGKKIIGPAEGTNQIYWEIHHIFRAFAGKSNLKQYQVKLWERNPLMDLMQGNWSGCCIAVGKRDFYPIPDLSLDDVDYKKYPAGILEFLIDQGIQVAEISDKRWGVVGQAWLFLTPNEDGGADLIADSIDIDSNRVYSRPQKRAVRSCLFRFLKNFAAKIGAKRALIGRNGPFLRNGQRRGIQIDVETADLPVVEIPQKISKIGGYFRNRPYFLESRWGDEAYDITNFKT